jgi:hypothetical protein
MIGHSFDLTAELVAPGVEALARQARSQFAVARVDLGFPPDESVNQEKI